jgi:hypothetical protein
MGKGLTYRTCWSCGGEEINYTFTEFKEGKRVSHWRNRAGEIHRCAKFRVKKVIKQNSSGWTGKDVVIEKQEVYTDPF